MKGKIELRNGLSMEVEFTPQEFTEILSGKGGFPTERALPKEKVILRKPKIVVKERRGYKKSKEKMDKVKEYMDGGASFSEATKKVYGRALHSHPFYIHLYEKRFGSLPIRREEKRDTNTKERKNKNWTEEEQREAYLLHLKGISYTEIARKMGRTRNAIRQRIRIIAAKESK